MQGDEHLAGKESKLWKPCADDVRPLFPMLQLVNRDRAHAMKRVVKRPWFADPFLKNVYVRFTDWFKAIEHSPMLQVWYQEFQNDLPDNIVTLQKSLSICLPRFDSASKPFAVAILTYYAMNLTAIKAFNERRNDPAGKRAKEYLLFVSGAEGNENAAQAGMLGDAGDEC